MLNYIATKGSNVPVGRVLIAQNDSVQLACITQFLTHLMFGADHFLYRICTQAKCLPLAKVFVLADNQDRATGTAFPVTIVHDGGCGYQMFEGI